MAVNWFCGATTLSITVLSAKCRYAELCVFYCYTECCGAHSAIFYGARSFGQRNISSIIYKYNKDHHSFTYIAFRLSTK
jgi:hypothetical protein